MTDSPSQPEAVVQRQIDAYNAHDPDAFAAEHAAGVRLFDLGGEVYLSGSDALRERYAQMFAHAPQIHVEIIKRIVTGSFVIDEERITNTHSGRDAHAAVIYEVLEGKIRRVWVTRDP